MWGIIWRPWNQRRRALKLACETSVSELANSNDLEKVRIDVQIEQKTLSQTSPTSLVSGFSLKASCCRVIDLIASAESACSAGLAADRGRHYAVRTNNAGWLCSRAKQGTSSSQESGQVRTKYISLLLLPNWKTGPSLLLLRHLTRVMKRDGCSLFIQVPSGQTRMHGVEEPDIMIQFRMPNFLHCLDLQMSLCLLSLLSATSWRWSILAMVFVWRPKAAKRRPSGQGSGESADSLKTRSKG